MTPADPLARLVAAVDAYVLMVSAISQGERGRDQGIIDEFIAARLAAAQAARPVEGAGLPTVGPRCSDDDRECTFAEEREPSGRLVLGPCLGCGTPAMTALAEAKRNVEYQAMIAADWLARAEAAERRTAATPTDAAVEAVMGEGAEAMEGSEVAGPMHPQTRGLPDLQAIKAAESIAGIIEERDTLRARLAEVEGERARELVSDAACADAAEARIVDLEARVADLERVLEYTRGQRDRAEAALDAAKGT